MSTYFPVVLDTEENGAVSAFVPGLPVYAAADTRQAAETAIRDLLRAYLEVHPAARPSAQVRVAQVSLPDLLPRRMPVRAPRVTIRGVGALLAATRSPARAVASRENGKLGGRPRKAGSKAMRAGRRAHARAK